MKNKMLWVTSFNEELYNASGKDLLDSFKITQTEGKWFIGSELTSGKLWSEKKIPAYNLWASEFLSAWLEKNKDIIPQPLGGQALPCNCRDPYARNERNHRKGCHHGWFNRNASRWFRKIATLYHALDYAKEQEFTHLLWLDCDCVFKQRVTTSFITEAVFEDADIVYMQSKRPVMEAGFVGYKLSPATHEFFMKWFGLYQSGNFRQLERWDDCYTFNHIMKNLLAFEVKLKMNDIAWNMSGHSDVMPHSRIGDHITHNKGKHGRQLGIMK